MNSSSEGCSITRLRVGTLLDGTQLLSFDGLSKLMSQIKAGET